jgi:hypothetical protein
MRVRRLDLGLVLLWCLTSLLACPEPEADAEVEPQQRSVCDAEGNLVQKAPAQRPYCYDNVAYGPDDERLDRCFFRGELSVCAPLWNLTEPTPAGPYECRCNDARNLDEVYLTVYVDIPDAGNCEAALEAACPVEPLEPAACKQPAVGGCGPVRDEPGRWTCQCAGSGQLQDIRHEACDRALALACPTPTPTPTP